MTLTCIHTHTYNHTNKRTHTLAHIHTHNNTRTHNIHNIRTYTCTPCVDALHISVCVSFMRLHTQTYECAYTRVHMYVQVCVCVYVHVSVCVCAWECRCVFCMVCTCVHYIHKHAKLNAYAFRPHKYAHHVLHT